MLSPTMIFNTAVSFMTNTNQQHYSGEVHLSYFSQIFFICWKQILSPVIGLAALVAIIRGLRGDKHMGNFYLDLWRGVAYFYVPVCFIVAVLLIAGGSPMTFQGNAEVAAWSRARWARALTGIRSCKSIARGPVAAIVAVKQFGTNGGGFFGANSAHPFENPNSWTNLLDVRGHHPDPCRARCHVRKDAQQFPARRRDLRRHAGALRRDHCLGGALRHAESEPRPHGPRGAKLPDCRPAAEGGQQEIALPAVAGLPVDQSLGNLEGKELRFGTSAGATWAALTTNTSNGR